MMMQHPAMRMMKMYKIELYDECCSPIADGTESYFVDDIEDFEEHWIPLVKERCPEIVDRYFRSKGGEIISDCLVVKLNSSHSAKRGLICDFEYIW